MLTVHKEMQFSNIHDLLEESWCGAKATLEEVIEQGREDEAMQIIEEVFFDDVPTDTQVNDFIWFDQKENYSAKAQGGLP